MSSDIVSVVTIWASTGPQLNCSPRGPTAVLCFVLARVFSVQCRFFVFLSFFRLCFHAMLAICDGKAHRSQVLVTKISKRDHSTTPRQLYLSASMGLHWCTGNWQP